MELLKFWLSILLPVTSFADEHGDTGGGGIGNPLKVSSIPELINLILGLVIDIGLPVVALAIIYVGFLFVSARGNESKLSEAKTAFLWTVVGAAIVLGAFVISTAIEGTINSLK